MSFMDKLEAAQKELSETNIWKSNHNPPILVLLRKLGFNIRPFHYCSFMYNFLTFSVWFGGAWGLIMWFTTWQSDDMPIQIALLTSLFAGLLFGSLMALYFKRSAKENKLSDWHTL
jgi:hypothetical protein